MHTFTVVGSENSWTWKLLRDGKVLAIAARPEQHEIDAQIVVNQILGKLASAEIFPIPRDSMLGKGFHFRITGSGGTGTWSIMHDNDELGRSVEEVSIGTCKEEIAELTIDKSCITADWTVPGR